VTDPGAGTADARRDTPPASTGARLRARAGTAIDALEHLVGGLATAVLALVTLFWLVVVLLLCVVGVGLRLLPSALRAVRVVADRERGRLSRWGPDVLGAPPVPRTLRAAVQDPAVRRDVQWLVVHGPVGFLLGLVGLTLPLNAVRDATFPLWWQLVPVEGRSPSMMLWVAQTQPQALVVTLIGLGWVAVALAALPPMARLQAFPGRRLLAPVAGADLELRVAELTATRAGALDAHVAELRRIERSLHDGTQNRVVAVTVLIGAARRALVRDPASADELLERAQSAAEDALADLRAVARSILPPVLTDRSLSDALTGLATSSVVPCRLAVDLPERCAAAIEATAYFSVAEALTNAARHSGARSVDVDVRRAGAMLAVRVQDDGAGGAEEGAGSGLAGIRRRAEAHDGTFRVTSPVGGPTTVEVLLPCAS
jgi:signal transduction histidine kinase